MTGLFVFVVGMLIGYGCRHWIEERRKRRRLADYIRKIEEIESR